MANDWAQLEFLIDKDKVKKVSRALELHRQGIHVEGLEFSDGPTETPCTI